MTYKVTIDKDSVATVEAMDELEAMKKGCCKVVYGDDVVYDEWEAMQSMVDITTQKQLLKYFYFDSIEIELLK